MFDFCQGLEFQSKKYLRRIKLGIGEQKFLQAPVFAAPLPKKSLCGRKDGKNKPKLVEVKPKMVGAKMKQEIMPATAEVMMMALEVGIECRSPLLNSVKVNTDLELSSNLLLLEGEKTSIVTTASSTPIKLFNETQSEPLSSDEKVTDKETNVLLNLPPAEVLYQIPNRCEKKYDCEIRSTHDHTLVSNSLARKSCGEDSDCESEQEIDDFTLYNKYEAHERCNPWDLRQLFDKVFRHFLPKLRDPMASRTLMEDNYLIPHCYKDLTQIVSAIEFAIFKLTTAQNPYSYLKIKEMIFKDMKM